MTSLVDFGVVDINFTITPEELDVKLALIKECQDWEDVIEILEQNRKTHPDDRVWILNNGMYQVMREVVK